VASAAGLTGWTTARWARFDGPSRLAGVDLARGLAVVGMLAAHLLLIDMPFTLDDPASWVDVVNGRSSILFATLAGVSLGLVTGGRSPLRGAARVRASARIAVRAGVLWVLGLLLVSTGVPVFVILPAYALLFLLALPFLGLRAPTLFVLAGALGLVMPFVQAALDSAPLWNTAEGEELGLVLGWHYPFPVWIAFVLAGMGAARADLRRTRTAVILLLAGTALAATGHGLDALGGSDLLEEQSSLVAAVWTARPHSSGLLEVVGAGGLALAVIGACVLACRTFLRWPAIPLRAVGSMPLTAYTAQLLVWAVWAASLFGTAGALAEFRAIEPFWPVTLGIVLACTLWALVVGRGPLEAGIDRLARWLVRDPGRAAAVDRLER
jgi:uncharacterized membrane protein